MPVSRKGVGRCPTLEIDVMMSFVMQSVVREGEVWSKGDLVGKLESVFSSRDTLGLLHSEKCKLLSECGFYHPYL